MIDLQQYKSNKLAKFNQLIVLDLSGKMMQSCNAIFDASFYQDKNIIRNFPFVESIFEIIKALKVSDSELLFSKVEKPSKDLNGFYDFTFSKIIRNNEGFILWSIYDFTALYKDLIDYQQRRNESEISRQHREKLLKLFSEEENKAPYFVEMITALRQRNNIVMKPFDLGKVIESVESAFSYKPNYKFHPYQIPPIKKLKGDATWFKFLLYNTLESILSTFNTVTITINIQPTVIETDIFINFRVIFNGQTKNANLIKTILSQEEFTAQQTLDADEQYLISKLYNVQKTLLQQNGYLELQQLDEKHENIKAILLCNFGFKYD